MKISIVCALAALSAFAAAAVPCLAQSSPNSIALRSTLPAASPPATKFTFMLFSKQNDEKTQRVTSDLAAALASHADQATTTAIDITDPANRELVDRFQVSRAPMPLVLCVAPNGAVTGLMVGRVTQKAVDGAFVTPTMSRCMKSLQAGKIVAVHVMGDEQTPFPAGAAEFLADPSFAGRVAAESLVVSDPAEGRFLQDMQLDRATFNGSTLVVLAPPGTLVGRFPATVAAADITAQLHSAGKCCNDPNCKHNRQGN